MLKFRDKAINLKFTNAIDFKMSMENLSYASLYTLPRSSSDREVFYMAWSIVLNEDLDESSFFDNLKIDKDYKDEKDPQILIDFLLSAKSLTLTAWARDCDVTDLIAPSQSSSPLSPKERYIAYLEFKEFICQSCQISRAEFDKMTPVEIAIALKVYRENSPFKILDLHLARLAYAKSGSKQAKLRDFTLIQKPRNEELVAKYKKLKAKENKEYAEYKKRRLEEKQKRKCQNVH